VLGAYQTAPLPSVRVACPRLRGPPVAA
jgi:hypothetical protein